MDKIGITRRQLAKERRKRWSRNTNTRKAVLRIERGEKRQAELEAEGAAT